MIEAKRPKFQRGQRVKAMFDLINDGSFPDAPAEGLLVNLGDIGEIVQVGRHTEANLPIYLVEFGEKLVVGCLEREIGPV
ncbi:nitrogen fixation protein NifZ [Bradyrhizobium arachidis]|uniref:nitrogen fixation protein NifZ n=1 Tax=Bradyrhizobium arachidis TaxID=858423 RepID=UPI00216369F0|nr:nitrogen fixation protein NifZ [Bradyrhizobium arachidis]UVO30617.1 nitrogen fixation protein NifZ [Bradyrhizobium arachidis]